MKQPEANTSPPAAEPPLGTAGQEETRNAGRKHSVDAEAGDAIPKQRPASPDEEVTGAHQPHETPPV